MLDAIEIDADSPFMRHRHPKVASGRKSRVNVEQRRSKRKPKQSTVVTHLKFLQPTAITQPPSVPSDARI
jgi:hypothetical protein